MVRYKSLRDGSILETDERRESLEASGKWELIEEETPAETSGKDKRNEKRSEG